MLLSGCDFRTRGQQIAMAEDGTGKLLQPQTPLGAFLRIALENSHRSPSTLTINALLGQVDFAPRP